MAASPNILPGSCPIRQLELPSRTSKNGKSFLKSGTSTRFDLGWGGTKIKRSRVNTTTAVSMPPRLPTLTACCRATPASSQPLSGFLLPFLQARNASILGSLSDNPGAYNKRVRRGRGPSSGKGKTSGRGHKGQKAHGKVPARFQGGQTPQEIVHGERGFENRFVFI